MTATVGPPVDGSLVSRSVENSSASVVTAKVGAPVDGCLVSPPVENSRASVVTATVVTAPSVQ